MRLSGRLALWIRILCLVLSRLLILIALLVTICKRPLSAVSPHPSWLMPPEQVWHWVGWEWDAVAYLSLGVVFLLLSDLLRLTSRESLTTGP